MANKRKTEKVLKSISDNYRSVESSIVNQLQLSTPNHGYITGTTRENVWKSLFEMIIPKKYCIEQGVFILDSYGNISCEVDLAIFDETYTPYIFHYGKIMFIPIEAVSVVVQCKSRVNSTECKNLKNWVNAVDGLKTSLDSVTRILTGMNDNYHLDDGKLLTQTATRPVKILCATKLEIGDERREELKNIFDISLYIEEGQIKKDIEDGWDYLKWNNTLNHNIVDTYTEEERNYRFSHKMKDFKNGECLHNRKLSDLRVTDETSGENVIMSLTFQLNQLLMLINNPMLFPHRAYCF